MHPTKTDWLRKPDPKVLDIPLELPEVQEFGKLKVKHYVFKKPDPKHRRINNMLSAMSFGFGSFGPEPPWNQADVCGTTITVEEGFTVTKIEKDGTLWMSDAPQERYMMERAAREARGKVLVGGCGLGMYVQYCLHHNKVSHITVVELDKDIYGLNQKSKWANDPRVTLVRGEISEFLEAEIKAGTKYDTVYLDTHPSITDDFLPYLNTLREMSRKVLTKARNKGHGHVYIWAYNKILGMNRSNLVQIIGYILDNGWRDDEQRVEFSRRFPIEAKFMVELEKALPNMSTVDRFSQRLVRHQTAEKLAKGFVLRIQSPKVIPLPQKKSDKIVLAAA